MRVPLPAARIRISSLECMGVGVMACCGNVSVLMDAPSIKPRRAEPNEKGRQERRRASTPNAPRVAAGRAAGETPEFGNPDKRHKKRGPRPPFRTASPVRLLLLYEFDTAVFEASCFGAVVSDRAGLAVAFCGQAVTRDALADQVDADSLGAGLRQHLVKFFATLAVGVPTDLDLHVTPLLQAFRSLIQDRVRVFAELRLAGVEIDAFQNEFPRYGRHRRRLRQGAAVGGLGVDGRALVDAVDHAVAVAVEFAAFGVHLAAYRGGGAFVGAIDHTVTIAVELAAVSIDLAACRRCWALVLAVDDTVAIRVERPGTRRPEQFAPRAADRAEQFMADRFAGRTGGVGGVVVNAFRGGCSHCAGRNEGSAKDTENRGGTHARTPVVVEIWGKWGVFFLDCTDGQGAGRWNGSPPALSDPIRGGP